MSEPATQGPKVAREVADGEFDRWVEAMGLSRKVDPSTLSDEDKKSLAEQKGILVEALMSGSLVLNEENCFVFTPTLGVREPITFYEPTGASLMATDAVKLGNVVQKQFRFLADMTRQGAQRFSAMKVRDLSVCLAVAALFLAT
jgi:hypothetical protein